MENSENKKIYIIIAMVFGILGGYLYGSKIAYNKGYAVGYEKSRVEIKSRLEEKRIVEPTPKEIRIISGKIISIGDNQFVLESQLPFDPTLPEGQQTKTVTKTVLVTPTTEISTRTVESNRTPPKSGETYKPFSVKIVKTDFESLKVSEQVVVEASENIVDKDLFKAVSIFKNSN